MKREIKFRALVIADGIKRVIDFNLPEMDNGLWGWPIDKNIYHIDEYLSPLYEFTGLKDKDVKDIYEGDIVEVFRTIFADDFTHSIKHVVEYNEGAFGYWLKDKIDFISFECNTNFKWKNQQSEFIKVVGNIYEKSELTNKK